MDADWSMFGFQTYLLLKPGTTVNTVALEKKLQAIHERNKPEDAPVPYLTQPLAENAPVQGRRY
jgi:putative ABC transport system permease protein